MGNPLLVESRNARNRRQKTRSFSRLGTITQIAVESRGWEMPDASTSDLMRWEVLALARKHIHGVHMTKVQVCPGVLSAADSLQ